MARQRADQPDHGPDGALGLPRAIHVDGAQRSVAFARLSNATEPARVFYNELDDGDKDKFDNLFLTLA